MRLERAPGENIAQFSGTKLTADLGKFKNTSCWRSRPLTGVGRLKVLEIDTEIFLNEEIEKKR